MVSSLQLRVSPLRLVVCRLPAGEKVQAPEVPGGFYSLTLTAKEVSIVCEERVAPPGARVEAGWRALVVAGPLDFSLVGILARLTALLAAAEVSVFAVSTFDTDYVLVQHEALGRAVAALRAGGVGVESDEYPMPGEGFR